MLERSIPAINVAADMVILGKRHFDAAAARPPFFPSPEKIEDISTKIWEQTDFNHLSGPDRRLIARAWGRVASHMSRRAELQRRERKLGNVRVRKNYQSKIFELSDGQVDLNPADFSLEWGLLCTALVVKSAAYTVLSRDLLENSRLLGTTGFVSPAFANELGPIAVIRRGPEAARTRHHEDAHVLTMLLGTVPDHSALITEFASDHFSRVVEKHQPRPGDTGLCLESVYRMRRAARRRIAGEFQADLWERRRPGLEVLADSDTISRMEAAAQITISAAYDPDSGLSDQQQIQTSFRVLKSGDDLNQYYYQLQAVIDQALDFYSGRFNKFEWAGSRLLVMPAGLPVKAYAQVLGVDMSGVRPEYTGNPASCLAEALATHAVMNMTGSPADHPQQFVDLVARIYRTPRLYTDLMATNDIDTDQFQSELLRRAADKLPPQSAALLSQALSV